MEISTGDDALTTSLDKATKKLQPWVTLQHRDTRTKPMQHTQNGRPYPPAPVSRDRVVAKFPKWYTPEACLQMKNCWHGQVKSACQDQASRNLGMMSKVVVVGDLYVGKTCLINRFCKDIFDRDYKATIGVDFEIEKFELSGVPFTLQIWDTAGQEKFKCIASAYYRGAQVIVTVFDLADIKTLENTRQWLEDAMKENEPGSCMVFLVGTKRDLLSSEECSKTETDAIEIANEMKAEFWSVSAKTGENVQDLFFRVAALAFEDIMLKELEGGDTLTVIGAGDLIRIDTESAERPQAKSVKSSTCC
ncbi:ras-related protein Rab-36 [Arapaima gigas]